MEDFNTFLSNKLSFAMIKNIFLIKPTLLWIFGVLLLLFAGKDNVFFQKNIVCAVFYFKHIILGVKYAVLSCSEKAYFCLLIHKHD